jgi:hypothetical protein
MNTTINQKPAAHQGINFTGLSASSGLDISHLGKGSYMYKLQMESGKSQNGILIVVK